MNHDFDQCMNIILNNAFHQHSLLSHNSESIEHTHESIYTFQFKLSTSIESIYTSESSAESQHQLFTLSISIQSIKLSSYTCMKFIDYFDFKLKTESNSKFFIKHIIKFSVTA